jgi:regulator of replication initiation timing
MGYLDGFEGIDTSGMGIHEKYLVGLLEKGVVTYDELKDISEIFDSLDSTTLNVQYNGKTYNARAGSSSRYLLNAELVKVEKKMLANYDVSKFPALFLMNIGTKGYDTRSFDAKKDYIKKLLYQKWEYNSSRPSTFFLESLVFQPQGYSAMYIKKVLSAFKNEVVLKVEDKSNELESKYKLALAQIEQEKARANSLASQLNRIVLADKLNKAKINSQLQSNQIEINNLKIQLEASKAETKNLKAQLAECKNNISTITSENTKLRKEIIDLKAALGDKAAQYEKDQATKKKLMIGAGIAAATAVFTIG